MRRARPEVPDYLEVQYLHRGTMSQYPVRGQIVPTRETVCMLLDDGGAPVGLGKAICSPRDQFCRRIGRDIALGRALKHLRRDQRSPERGRKVLDRAHGVG